MERTEDIFPIELITSEHIQEVISTLTELSQIRYWKEKNSRFREKVPLLTEHSKWLLTFCVWFTEHNNRFLAVDCSRYYTIEPAREQSSSFMDFIKIIQQYNRKRVAPKNEIHLVKFLQGCDRVHFDFYLLLLSKSFTNSLPKTEVYDVLDVGTISLQEIYGPIELLQTSFSELMYPVAVRMLPDPDYKLIVQSREPRRTHSYYQTGCKLKVTKDLVSLDSKYINTPRYTVVGYTDVKQIQNRKKKEERTIIYPLDYFSTWKEYRGYVKTKTDKFKYTPFKERIENLKKFLADNYLRQFEKTPIGYAENEHELAQQIKELYPSEGNTFIVITDNNTARTGKAVAIPVTNTAGMIHSIWLDNGVPKGFEVWFNGHLNKVEFSFTGANNAILNSPDMVLNKMLGFMYARVGPLEVFVGKDILWEQLQWKAYRHKGIIYVEKCALCGGTDQPHKIDGLCRVCEINIRKYFTSYGVDNWITPSRKVHVKRCQSGWHPKILDVMKPSFQGHYIVAREDGCWKFVYDEERMSKYQEYYKDWLVSKNGGKKKHNDS